MATTAASVVAAKVGDGGSSFVWIYIAGVIVATPLILSTRTVIQWP